MTTRIHCAECGAYLGRWTPATHWQPGEADVRDSVVQNEDGDYFCDQDCEEQHTLEGATQ